MAIRTLVGHFLPVRTTEEADRRHGRSQFLFLCNIKTTREQCGNIAGSLCEARARDKDVALGRDSNIDIDLVESHKQYEVPAWSTVVCGTWRSEGWGKIYRTSNTK